jgi:hypothetical protein
MASVNMIPWEQALAAEKAAFDQNRQLMMMGVAPEGGFRNDYAYMGDTFDPAKWLQQKGFWQQGFRPGMDLPQINASNMEDFVEMATPMAVMAGTALGGSALFGPAAGGAAAGATGAAGGASAAGGGGYLGSGISAGTVSGGIGGGALGSGLTAGTTTGAIGGGALGSGIGVGAGSAATGAGLAGAGALAPGFFATEAAVPMAAGQGFAAAPAIGGTASPAATTATVAGGAPAATGLSSLLSNPQLMGMAGGALLGGLGGSSGPAGTTTTTTDQGLPDWLMPYAKPALDKYSSMVQNYNVDPYGVMPSAMQEYQKGLSGYYLDPSTNKYLNDYFNAGAERIKSTIQPSFGHMQAFGGHSGYNEALSRGLADFSTGLFGGAYNKERDRMSQYSATAPSFLQQSTNAQMGPYPSYLNTIGSLGKKSTSNQPYFEGSDWQNILGGALTGWGLGNVFKT